jgi:peptide/nickel transport system substrate-binding protein
MGTGQYMVKEWQPDQKLVMVKNPNYWGKNDSNVTEIIYTPIKSEATRVAALLSGEVDFVLDPSPQDLGRLRANPNLKVIDGVENRTIFFGMDQFRNELPGSNIKGKNPLKDVKVRMALYQAIDSDSLHRVTMRGLSQPTGTLVARRWPAGPRRCTSASPTTRKPPRSCWLKPATRRASRWTSPAPTTATSTTRKSARP